MRNLLISSEWEPQVSLPSNEKTCFPVALRKKWYLHARDLQLYCSDDSTQGDLTCRPQYIIVSNFTNSPESSITGALCFPHPYFVKPMFIKPDFFKKWKSLFSNGTSRFVVRCQLTECCVYPRVYSLAALVIWLWDCGLLFVCFCSCFCFV